MYNYGRNIALKLRASLLLKQGEHNIRMQKRQAPGKEGSFCAVSNIHRLPMESSVSAECQPQLVSFLLCSSPCINAAKNIEPDERWEQEASKAEAKFNIINKISVKRSSARIEETSACISRSRQTTKQVRGIGYFRKTTPAPCLPNAKNNRNNSTNGRLKVFLGYFRICRLLRLVVDWISDHEENDCI